MGASTIILMLLIFSFFQAIGGTNRVSKHYGQGQGTPNFEVTVQNGQIAERIYKKDLVLSACNGSTSAHLFASISNNSMKSSSSPFASHELPHGTILELSLEPAGWLNCVSSTPSARYEGLEVMEVERKLIGNGAHRELSSSITIRLEKSKACHIVIVEKLPSGVFADMFELGGLVARGAYIDAVIYGDHNLEMPSLHSSESIVVLHTSIDSNTPHLEHLLQAKVLLPLHARYPPLSFESHVSVNFSIPHVLFQCFHNNDDNSAANMTDSKPNRNNMAWAVLTWKESTLDSNGLQWAVPAGNPLHSQLVAVTTACTSLIGVVVLLVVSRFSFNSQKSKVA